MKITLNNDIVLFLSRCRENLQYDDKNDFIGLHVTKANEKAVQKAMHDSGFGEFSGPEDSWPSLFISTDAWEKSPYHSHISLDMVKSSHFSYVTEKTAGHELFNVAAIQKDPERELNDWMKLRAMDRNFDAIYLYQDEEEWMMDVPSEAETNNLPASKAHGNVLTFGLGIGYFLYMALLNPEVKSVTCVEKSDQVIDMFERFLLPQFPQDKEIRLIQGDASDLFYEPYLSQYDYVYTDIWRSTEDGLPIIEKLLKQYCLPVEKGDFWIEDSCLEPLWNLSFECFDEIATGAQYQRTPAYQYIFKHIQKYYANLDETVTSSAQLKEYMYDTHILRQILAMK